MNIGSKAGVALLLLACGCVAKAQESPELEQGQQPLDNKVIRLETTIRGSREQPKVMSIVPWQGPSQKQVLPSPILQRIGQKFSPLKRDEFQRQIQFFEKLSTK